jgi:hypothetical protein
MTCWHNYSLYKEHIQHRVYKAIADWYIDPTRLLEVMKKHRVVISGSIPIAVAGDSSFIPGDIDFFLPPGSMEAMIKFFVDEGSYSGVLNANAQNTNEADTLVQAYMNDINGEGFPLTVNRSLSG